MVCPYCSTDMTPIELNGKVFCSNCGLTIANNAPQVPYEQPTINPAPETITGVATEAPEEIEFPVIPEVVAAVETPVEAAPAVTPTDYFGQFSNNETTATPESIGRKLEISTDESEVIRPITEQTAQDLGIETIVAPEPTESKIADLVIPSEDDFAISEPTAEPSVPMSSYVELANPGDEKETLEASGILLDILGEETTPHTPVAEVATPEMIPVISEPLTEIIPTMEEVSDVPELDPISEPEIPEHTETQEEDDLYVLPTEIKVGLRKKKSTKGEVPVPVETKTPEFSEEVIDAKTEKRIEALEKEITEIPEPVISITPDEVTQIDPDTISKDEIHVDDNEKSKIIKDYFTTAIEKDKTKIKTKKKKAKNKKSLKVALFTLIGIVTIAGLGTLGYFGYNYYTRPTAAAEAKENVEFNTFSPTYIPEGYTLLDTKYTSSTGTHETVYQFADDAEKTIVLKQIKTDNAEQTISDYLQAADTTYIEKVQNGVTYTETAQPSLIWKNGDFVLILETKNFTYSNDFIYKMAEAVN